jgi:DNA-binding NtrC family response regulator
MEEEERVLVVEDDSRVRQALFELLTSWGYTVETAGNGAEGLEAIASFHPAVVLSDLQMPGLDGLELLKTARSSNPELPFLMLTGHGSIASAVEATKLGAFNFLQKPVDPGRLQIELRNCLDGDESERQLQIARGKRRDLGAPGTLVGHSKGMREVMSVINLAASSSASVFISGESGAGKEVVARTIHGLSSRSAKPFVAVNCAAIPESLMESEIFGHEKGAFTDAIQARMGCFELAHGGTLLLDEIGEMPLATQAKLLRVLEDSKVRRLGGKSEITVDVRVLASTNREPQEALSGGRLRSDVFYRLNVVHIRVPPLRDHLEDLEELIAALLEDLNRKHNRSIQAVEPDAIEMMRRYRWPGNVRELRNALEYAVVTSRGNIITKHSLLSRVKDRLAVQVGEAVRLRAGMTVAELERRLILETLSQNGQNKTRAAGILGITTKTLNNKLEKYANRSAAACALDT